MPAQHEGEPGLEQDLEFKPQFVVDAVERTVAELGTLDILVNNAALKHLKAGGAIINTGSETGLQGAKELLDYSATKGAIHAFTKALAQNLVERGIRVNCVAPGPVWTPLNPQSSDAEKVGQFGQQTPMGRPAQPRSWRRRTSTSRRPRTRATSPARCWR